MMKKISFVLFAFIISSSHSQYYEYAIVKSKFDFVSSVDGYSTSSLTKFLLSKNGYKTFLDNETLPEELINNKCLAVYINVVDNSGFLNTRLKFEFRDCNDELLRVSGEGYSKLKNRRRAYHLAIKGAFSTLKSLKIPRANLTNGSKSSDDVFIILNAFKLEKEYLLFDTQKKLKYKILPTKSKEKFMLVGLDGFLIKERNYWVLKYTEDGRKKMKKLIIEF